LIFVNLRKVVVGKLALGQCGTYIAPRRDHQVAPGEAFQHHAVASGAGWQKDQSKQ
jgi:hypothetical protein